MTKKQIQHDLELLPPTDDIALQIIELERELQKRYACYPGWIQNYDKPEKAGFFAMTKLPPAIAVQQIKALKGAIETLKRLQNETSR